VKNEPHEHRLRSSVSELNTDRANTLIHENWRILIIMKKHLHYRKVNARWVPHTLMDVNKMVCMQAAVIFYSSLKMKSIVTTDETWAHYFISESQQSSRKG
jgi:hypothetical protein